MSKARVVGVIRYTVEIEVDEEYDDIESAEDAVSLQRNDPLNSQFGKFSELSGAGVSAEVDLSIEEED